MKTVYDTPKMEIINLNQADVIVTSSGANPADNPTSFFGGSTTSLE